MDETLSYELLRSFTTPVVAITAERDGKLNGMISDAATRASIVPDVPRLMILVHKFNFTHDMILDTGRFVVHALHRGQFELIERLGFESGRERDKLADVPYRLGNLGCPVQGDHDAGLHARQPAGGVAGAVPHQAGRGAGVGAGALARHPRRDLEGARGARRLIPGARQPRAPVQHQPRLSARRTW
jgi:hypothetical protein